MDRDLGQRLFKFTIDTVKFLRDVKSSPELSVFKYQLTKSASSAGANYEEAQAASSRKDFNSKIDISLREMREANYWLRIFKELEMGSKEKCSSLVSESDELRRILGTIAKKTSK